MKVQVYSAKNFEKPYFDQFNQGQHTFHFTPESLSLETVRKAQGCEAVACFVNDTLDLPVIQALSEMGVRLIALRSVGYDHVDGAAAKAAGITVVRVPDYSPESVAEFAVALILALNRKLLQACLQGLTYNFSLEGLLGFNLHQKVIGIVGTGRIGTAFAKIMKGFGCDLIATDPIPNSACLDLGVKYVALETLLNQSDVVSLHCPLNEETSRILGRLAFSQMKQGALLINTGRGGLIDTVALIEVIESGHLSGAGLDVYEKEKGLFFKDHQGIAPKDPVFLKLQSLPQVMITPHQAFLTVEAISNIARVTVESIAAFEENRIQNEVCL